MSVVQTVLTPEGPEAQRMFPDAAGPEARTRQERRAFVRRDAQDRDIGVPARGVGPDRGRGRGWDAGWMPLELGLAALEVVLRGLHRVANRLRHLVRERAEADDALGDALAVGLAVERLRGGAVAPPRRVGERRPDVGGGGPLGLVPLEADWRN